MVKRKNHIVKSGIHYNYLKDNYNHSLNDLSNGFLKNIKLETTDSNYQHYSI